RTRKVRWPTFRTKLATRAYGRRLAMTRDWRRHSARCATTPARHWLLCSLFRLAGVWQDWAISTLPRQSDRLGRMQRSGLPRRKVCNGALSGIPDRNRVLPVFVNERPFVPNRERSDLDD